MVEEGGECEPTLADAVRWRSAGSVGGGSSPRPAPGVPRGRCPDGGRLAAPRRPRRSRVASSRPAAVMATSHTRRSAGLGVRSTRPRDSSWSMTEPIAARPMASRSASWVCVVGAELGDVAEQARLREVEVERREAGVEGGAHETRRGHQRRFDPQPRRGVELVRRQVGRVHVRRRHRLPPSVCPHTVRRHTILSNRPVPTGHRAGHSLAGCVGHGVPVHPDRSPSRIGGHGRHHVSDRVARRAVLGVLSDSSIAGRIDQGQCGRGRRGRRRRRVRA